jgi:hypothetical protein
MEKMFAVIAGNPAAFTFGMMGMTCLAAWPLFSSRRTMLTAYIGNNLAFILHYGLLGCWTASTMNVLLAMQTLVAIRIDDNPRYRQLYYALMFVLAGLVFMTWDGLPSVFAATATAFSTLGRMQRHEIALRTLMLAAMPCWLAHDLIVSSLPGLSADILSIAIGTTMLLQRLWARWHMSNMDASYRQTLAQLQRHHS